MFLPFFEMLQKHVVILNLIPGYKLFVGCVFALNDQATVKLDSSSSTLFVRHAADVTSELQFKCLLVIINL